jgi:hypothetical protein
VKHSIAVNCGWPVPSTAGPRFELLFVPRFHVFGNGVSSSTRGAVCLSEQAPCSLLRNSARVYPHSHRVHVRLHVPYVHHARSVTLL